MFAVDMTGYSTIKYWAAACWQMHMHVYKDSKFAFGRPDPMSIKRVFGSTPPVYTVTKAMLTRFNV